MRHWGFLYTFALSLFTIKTEGSIVIVKRSNLTDKNLCRLAFNDFDGL